ncbi:hypothetical protein DFH29DRAFT_818141 [Suillus ampliporus]|nr:hypothetical protein DFH29DRAFT_818141 [Suillus ampliporus]
MSSDTPQNDLWIERARLDGMVVGGVFYGMFFLLTVQAWIALMKYPQFGGRSRHALLFYIFITFVLRTINFAANAKYTEMIWIDLHGAPGGPDALIEDEMDYRINVLAIYTSQIHDWFMQALLLHRCFVIWNWSRRVMIPMITLYIAMIALSIFSLTQASTGAVVYNISIIPVFVSVQVGLAVIYTILVMNRLLLMRRLMRRAIAQYDSSAYNTVVVMVIESALLSSVFSIIFVVAFALHLEGVTTLCFLSIDSVQGIAQLFIILRVARGQAVTHEWSSRAAAAPTTIGLSGFCTTEKSNDERIARPEKDVVETHSASMKEEADVCIA